LLSDKHKTQAWLAHTLPYFMQETLSIPAARAEKVRRRNFSPNPPDRRIAHTRLLLSSSFISVIKLIAFDASQSIETVFEMVLVFESFPIFSAILNP